MRELIFYLISSTFIIQSCVSPNQNQKLSQEKSLDSIVLLINNDSIISINGLEINFSELDVQLDQILPSTRDRSYVTIKSDPSIKMGIIFDVEDVLLSKSVQEITYLCNGQSVIMRLVLADSNQIKLELTKDDKLIFGNIQIKSDEDLLLLIQSLTKGIPNPNIVIDVHAGAGNNAYLEAKDRVQELLIKNDLDIKLGEVSNNYYERIK